MDSSVEEMKSQSKRVDSQPRRNEGHEEVWLRKMVAYQEKTYYRGAVGRGATCKIHAHTYYLTRPVF
jgi:hypothetical protein